MQIDSRNIINLIISANSNAEDDANYDPISVTEASIAHHLNYRLALAKNISVGNVKKIGALHRHLNDNVFNSAALLSPKEDKEALRQYGKHVEQVEFAMQELWKFEYSSAHHTHWARIPHCICNKEGVNPYLAETWGVIKSREIDCPVHGIIVVDSDE